MTSLDFGLPLVEAARRSGVTVNWETPPQSRHFESDALRLHYLEWNARGSHAKPPIICLHGFAQNAHMWDFFALAHAHERRIIALDQRGHGDSAWPQDRDYSLEAFHKDLSSLMNAAELDRPVVMGLSMGGRNAYTYTGLNPSRVRALTVVDVGPEIATAGGNRIREFTQRQDVLPSFDAFVERTLKYSPLREEWSVRGSLRHQIKQLSDGTWTWKYDPALRDPAANTRHASLTIERGWALWQSIECPSLIVRGGNSDVFPREVADRMERESRGQATLVEVPHAGHLVPGDNPVGFEQAVKQFYSEH